MPTKISAWLPIALVLSPLSLFAEEKPKMFELMDYGRFMSASYNNAEGKNAFSGSGCVTSKGIAIKLGPGTEATMLFDTDLLRMSGGWTGGFINLKGVIFDGSHATNPTPAKGASIVFQTNPVPGWTIDNQNADPRKANTGPEAASIPFGPLPKEMAKYQGLYLHGDRVVLAYTVGGAPLLELPGMETAEGQTLLTRTFNVNGSGSHTASLLAADGLEAASLQIADGFSIVSAKNDPKEPDSRLFIGVIGAPAAAKWATIDGAARLQLPTFTGKERFKVVYWRATAADLPRFAAALKKAARVEELAAYTKGGPAHWPESVVTQGQSKAQPNDPYVVDSIVPPSDNPYKSWIRFGGFDFLNDGRAAFTTWSGDVWIASGLDQKLEKVSWRRFATGLFQPLGLKVSGGQIYVLGRDQITRLVDLNGDGEADFYENFNNDVQVTPNFHEFALDLQTDPAGNFYFAKGGTVRPGGRGWEPIGTHNGTMLKVSKDGQKLEVYATGLRAPNGMGISPTGVITCGDNQGSWVPACYLHQVKPNDFLSVPTLSHREQEPTAHGTHLCYFPMDVDNSSGAQVTVPNDKWGPFKDRLLHLSYGQACMYLVMDETVEGVSQAGVVKFPVTFTTGVMRARFNPIDGQLYVAGLRGWQTKGTNEAGFYRVRYTGKPITIQTALKVSNKGIRIGFSNPVDPTTAGNADNYSIEQYNYQWTSAYGSPDFKVSDPKQQGRDPVEIKSVALAPDGKSVFLSVAGLCPVDQMRIKMNIKGADGTELPSLITNTINAVGKE